MAVCERTSQIYIQEEITMTRGIRVKNTDDIQKINKIVTRYGFDIWIHGKSGMVDAKSLLGMFLLSLNEPLQIVLEDDEDPAAVKALFKDLAEYLEIDGLIFLVQQHNKKQPILGTIHKKDAPRQLCISI